MLRSCGALALLLAGLATLTTSCADDVRSMRRNRDVEGLASLLSSSDDQLRIQVVDALGDLGDSRSVQPLVRALRDRSPYVREHAARFLGCDDRSSLGCSTAEPVPALIELFDDEDEFVRVEAARSVGEHPITGSREPLERLARSDPSPQVRRAAAHALGHIASVASRPVLESLARDGDPRVAEEARASLEAIEVTARAAAARSERPGQGGLEVDVEIRPPAGDAGPDAGRVAPAGDAGSGAEPSRTH
jgi:HEAT repeat protein